MRLCASEFQRGSSMSGECGVSIYNSQSIPGSCLMAGTMVLGEDNKWYMVLVGSVNTWGRRGRKSTRDTCQHCAHKVHGGVSVYCGTQCVFQTTASFDSS